MPEQVKTNPEVTQSALRVSDDHLRATGHNAVGSIQWAAHILAQAYRESQARINELEIELAAEHYTQGMVEAAEAKLRSSEAAGAEMRRILRGPIMHGEGVLPCGGPGKCQIHNVLESTAGSSLLARMEALERVVKTTRQLRKSDMDWVDGATPKYVLCCSVDSALAALAGLGKETK